MHNIQTGMRAMKGILLIAVIFFALKPAQLKADIIMQPYLQAPTQHSIYILAECDTQTPFAAAEYGKTPAYGLSATAENVDDTTVSSYVHKIKIPGLSPGTTYHYRVLQGGSFSSDRTFTTAPLSNAPFRFAFMADCHDGTGVHAAIARLIEAKNPGFSIYGGDVCSSGEYTSFKNDFFIGPELELISRVPFFLSPGNHEGWPGNTKAFTQQPGSASNTRDYYSFDWGAAHFLILNTEADFGAAGAQYKFAAADLAGTKEKWKIAVFHKPAYAQGGDWWGEPDPTRQLADAVLSPGGVQLVLAGHMHYYQHNFSHGTHYLVVSPAGGYQEDPKNDSYTIYGHKGFHFAVTDVDTLSLRVRIYDETGGLVDTVLLPYKGALPKDAAATQEWGKATKRY
jgi:hypothetical protein